MGVGFGIGTGFLIDPLTKRFSLKQCTITGCILAAIAMILTVTAPQEFYIWFEVVLVAIAMAVAYSTILTLFSNQVDDDSQGWVMGVTGAIMALAFGVNGLRLGVLSKFSLHVPILVAAVCLMGAAGLMGVIYKTTRAE